MQTATTFCLTGFSDEETQTHLVEVLTRLGCKYLEKLAQGTSVLVVNSTATEKFKIAKLNKVPIPCVTKKWVEDCAKKNKLLPLDKYLIGEKQMFLGTRVAICGFEDDKAKKIQKIIQEKGGESVTKYKAVDIIRKYNEIDDDIDVILGSSDEIERARHAKIPFSDDHILCLVRFEWLQHSLNKKRCKYPNDYAVNLIKTAPVTRNAARLATKLKNFLENDIMDKSMDYLQDTLIYIDKDFAVDFARLLKNLVAVCGGYWTDKFSPIVTHALLTDVDDMKYQDFKRYGSRIHILRPEWLVDSILLYNRMDEEDYLVRCFKINGQAMRVIMMEEQNRNNQNSQNFNSLPGLGDRRLTLSSNTLPAMLENERKRPLTQPTSDVFKGRNFYFPPQVRQDQSYFSEIKKLIVNAGGHGYDKINRTMNVYVPLKDSPVVKEVQQKMKNAQYKSIIVSDRWVKDCVKKNTFIDPDFKKYFHYRAFCFVTPLSDFHKYVFDLVGFEQMVAPRIRDLLSVLGSTKTNPNKSELTHILCGPMWKDDPSQEKIKKVRLQLERLFKKDPTKKPKTVQLIKSEWLFDCLNQKKSLSTVEYVIETLKNVEPQTPNVKTEDHNESSEHKTTETQNQSHVKLTP